MSSSRAGARNQESLPSENKLCYNTCPRPTAKPCRNDRNRNKKLKVHRAVEYIYLSAGLCFSPRKLPESPEVTLLWAVRWEQESRLEALWDRSLAGQVLPRPGPCRAWGDLCLVEGPLRGETQEQKEKTCPCFPGPVVSRGVKGAEKACGRACLALARLPGPTVD